MQAKEKPNIKSTQLSRTYNFLSQAQTLMPERKKYKEKRKKSRKKFELSQAKCAIFSQLKLEHYQMPANFYMDSRPKALSFLQENKSTSAAQFHFLDTIVRCNSISQHLPRSVSQWVGNVFRFWRQLSHLPSLRACSWCICCEFSPFCVFKCLLKVLAWEDAQSHWLHFFNFSPLCVFKCLLN